MVYQWKQAAASVRHLDAQRIGEHLERLREQHGALTPELLVEDAEHEGSPLALAFQWDDQAAAHEYRLSQARELLRFIVVVREDDRPPMRAFVVVSDADKEQHYQSVEVALGDDNMRAQVLSRALKELSSWRRRYEELTELAEIFAAADKVAAA